MSTPAGPWAVREAQSWARGVLKGWTGSAWVPVRAWDGTQWQPPRAGPAQAVIEVVGTAGASVPTVALPPHQAGDLIMIHARRATEVPATVPAGWTQIEGGGANWLSLVSGYLVATGSSHTSGTWANASQVVAVVLRANSGPVSVGASSAGQAATSPNVVFPALAVPARDGVSMGIRVATRATASLIAAPPGWTVDIRQGADADAVIMSSSLAGISGNLPAATVAQPGSWHYRAHTIEVHAPAIEPPPPVLVPDVIGFRAGAGSVQNTEHTVPIPGSVQQGDLVICAGTVASAGGTPASIGVTVTGSGGTVTPVLLASNPVPGEPSRTAVWAWTAPGPGGVATLTAPVSVDWPGVAVAAYSGAALPSPADIVFASSGGATVTQFTAPTISVTEPGSWAVHVGGQGGPGSNWIASGPGVPRAHDEYRYMANIADSGGPVAGTAGGGTWQLGTSGGAQPNYAWAHTLRLAPRMIPGNGGAAPAAQPYPAALHGQGHALAEEWKPADLMPWRFLPGTSTNVTFGNANGASGQVNSTRYVSIVDDYLHLESRGLTSAGCIQSPVLLPTASGVLECLIRFSGVSFDGQNRLPGWGSWWMYGPSWPVNGELDTVETMFGQSWVGYHWGNNATTQKWDASTNPWPMSGQWTGGPPYPPSGKVVQLQPMGANGQPRPAGNTDSYPLAPNLLPDVWTHVTVAFDGSPPSRRIRVWYDGTLYTAIQGDFVLGQPMWIACGTGFGNFSGGLGQDQRLEVTNSIDIRWVRRFT